ncbi:N-acetyltransferase family protein (plasmid) [Pseudomonas luteola]
MELAVKKFKDINLDDPFFDSLKASYKEFSDWFKRKAEDSTYIFENENGTIDGFLYLKVENGPISDVTPPLPSARRLKVGTLKINAHGTKMGERFVKKIIDHAVHEDIDEIYVTVFAEHDGLIRLLSKYGFEVIGSKTTANGTEEVMLKSLKGSFKNIYDSYPVVSLDGAECYVLAIKPEWHTRLLPDSILNNESNDIVEDISHANSIHKVYLTSMNGIEKLKQGDVVVIYRMTDGKGPAHYRSVATSICVIEEYRDINSFSNRQEFFSYCRPHSVFTQDELNYFWNSKRFRHVFKFTYNIAFKKRVTRGVMIEEIGLPASEYWGFFGINKQQLLSIAAKGEVDESLIVNKA